MITNTKGITINKVILHVLTKKSDEILSNQLLDLDDPDFIVFLENHIKSAIRRTTRRPAKYNNASNHLIKENLENLFSENKDDFINASINVANRLNGIIKQKNYGPYYFLVCNYTNEDDETYVALIVLDFSKSFYHNVADNHTIIKHILALSSSDSKFKKCAILKNVNIIEDENVNPNADLLEIAATRENDELEDEEITFDLIINEPVDTEFFRINFLQCDLFNDNKKLATEFIENTIGWCETKMEFISSDEQNLTTEQIQNKLTAISNLKSNCISQINSNESIDIQNFIDYNFNNTELHDLREDYENSLEEKNLVCNEILVDDEIRSNFKVNKIKLDNGILLTIPVGVDSDYYNSQYSNDLTVNFNISGKIVHETVKQK